MASDILTYSPSSVKLILVGYILTGVVSINVAWKGSKPFTTHRGIRGKHTRVYNPEQYATITVEVLQTSITNDILTSIVSQDRKTRSARLEFSIVDTSGSTKLQSTNCFVQGYPELTLSGDLTTRKWDFECLSFLDGASVGGNARQGFDILDPINGAIDYISGAGAEAWNFANDLTTIT